MTQRTPLALALLVLWWTLPALAAPPVAAVASPQAEATVTTDSQAVVVLFNAAEGRKVDRVELLVDGELCAVAPVAPALGSGSVTLVWPAQKWLNGGHRLQVRARDTRGEVGESSLNLFLDRGAAGSGAPQVMIESPKPGELITGSTEVKIRAFDPDGIKYVMLLVDDVFACLTNIPPFRYLWNTTRHANGRHTLRAKAFDTGENEGVSPEVEVLVENAGGRTELQQPETAPAPAEPVIGLPEPAPAAAPEPKPAPAAPDPKPLPAASAAATAPVAPQAPEKAPASSLPAASQPATPALASRATQSPGQVKPTELAMAPALLHPKAAGETVFAPPALATASRPAALAPVMEATARPALPATAPAPAAAAHAAPLAPARATASASAPAPAQPAGSQVEARPAAAPMAPAAPSALPLRTAAPTAMAVAGMVQTTSAAVPAQAATTASTSRPQAPLPRTSAGKPAALQVAMVPAHDGPATALPTRVPAASLPVAPAQRTAAPASAHTATAASCRPVAVALAPAQQKMSQLAQPTLTMRSELTVFLNDKPLTTDAAPLITPEGLALTPFRHVIEGAGGWVYWSPDSHSITARAQEQDIRLLVGSREAQVEGRTILMDVATFIERGRAMVPVRFFREALGYEVRYDPASGGIYIAVK